MSAGYNVPIGNMNAYVIPKIADKASASVLIAGLSGDPANGCAKSFNATYKCGTGVTKTINVAREAGGRTAVFDCSKEDNLCKNYKLTVQDDGNLVLTNNAAMIWQSNTAGKIGLPDPSKNQ